MKRLAFVLMLGVFMALGTRHADATLCSIPNTFTNGTVADANQVNANFSAFQTCGNNIDHNNIGTGGIYASQLAPVTVAQAIFGGGVGYTFDPNVSNQVPLTIIGATSQSVDLLDVFSVGQTTKYVWVDSSGVLHTNQSMVFGGVPTWTGALPIAQGGTGATTFAGANIAVTNANNSFSTTQTIGGALHLSQGAGFNALDFQSSPGFSTTYVGSSVNAVASVNAHKLYVWDGTTGMLALDESGNFGIVGGLSAGGTIQGTVGGTRSYVPPVYTAAGAAVASTMHGVVFSGTLPGSTTTCGPYSGAYCVSVTLSGAAIFASASSWDCGSSGTIAFVSNAIGGGYYATGDAGSTAGVATNDGTHFYISASSIAGDAGKTYRVTCWGT